jgi:hypothetical protein
MLSTVIDSDADLRADSAVARAARQGVDLVQDLGSGFRVQGFRVYGSGSAVGCAARQGVGFVDDLGSGFRVQGLVG